MTNPPTDEAQSNESMIQESVADVLPTDEFSQYLLYSKSEMLSILRGLVERATQVTMTFNEGRHMVLTSVLGCDSAGMTLEFGASEEMNLKALKAETLFCVSRLDKVKIQFILRSVKRIEEHGREAFRAALPESILRLQRREHYRLVTPVLESLKCRLFVPNPGGSRTLIDARIADISGGGICLTGLPESLAIEPDMVFHACAIELPEGGTITTAVRLRSVNEISSRSGIHTKRAGCEFVNLPGPMERLIQRYIMKVERERKARESGIG